MGWTILLIVLIVLAVLVTFLYFFGKKQQKRQAESQVTLDAMKQVMSILVIDKKKLKPSQSGLPQVAIDQVPKYLRWSKLPIVKAKYGPKVMTLVADAEAFEQLPVKKEAKVQISGIYITKVLSIRGGTIPQVKKKGRRLGRFIEKLQSKIQK